MLVFMLAVVLLMVFGVDFGVCDDGDIGIGSYVDVNVCVGAGVGVGVGICVGVGVGVGGDAGVDMLLVLPRWCLC